MSTQFVQDGTLASNLGATGLRGVDPRRRRFALNPNIYMASLDPRESGRQEILLPTGLVSFRTAQMANDDFDNALKNGGNPSARNQTVREDVTALTFLSNALIRFGEQGLRELTSLTFMDDAVPGSKKSVFNASAQGYFAALWPSFAEIGHVCPADLKECVTCRLWLIGDSEDDEQPMQEVIFDRTSKLENQDKVEEMRAEVVGSLKANRSWLDSKWASLIGEREDRKNGSPAIAKFGPGEHHVRRNLHEVEPSEAATAGAFGMEVAAGQAEGFKELAAAMREGNGDGSNEILKLIVERQNKTDDAIASLANSVKQLVETKKAGIDPA